MVGRLLLTFKEMRMQKHMAYMGSKRGSDELLSQSGGGNPVSNGNAMSPQMNNHHQDNNNDAKKVKLDSRNNGGVNRPSRVVHLRNIPTDASEMEVIQLGLPFGRVTNILMLKGKNQAFLELDNEITASTMVNYFTSTSANMRGRPVFVQFSNHKELKTDNTHANNMTAQAALQSVNAMINQSDAGGPNTVLRVIIDNMLYPVTLDILHQIFSRIAKVLRIVTFNKNNTFQALIQYPDTVSAQTTKMTLDGQNIYNNCCTLRIEFSKLTTLSVKFNNDRCRDYTNPTLGMGDPGFDFGGMTNGKSHHGAGMLASPFATVHSLASPLSAYQTGVPGLPLSAAAAAGLPSLASFAAMQGGASAAQTMAALGAAGFRLPGSMSPVLLVSNLNEELVTPDALFTLFGVYGDCQRVKILYNKKDNALIQMSDPHQAQLAMTHLDKIPLFGKPIHVMPSKYQTVQLPKEGQQVDAGLTKDYDNSNLHRFKKPGSKNYQNIYPPSATLHLSNIPPDTDEEVLKAAFGGTGGIVKGFRFFQDHKMALLQMSSVSEAVVALIKMHDYPLNDTSRLRVSFSKSSI